jgi:hypothetical protein
MLGSSNKVARLAEVRQIKNYFKVLIQKLSFVVDFVKFGRVSVSGDTHKISGQYSF